MDDFIRDLKHSVRMFLQSPGFTITAVAALTLGIGANTAIFSVVDAVLLKPVPFPDPPGLVMLMNTSAQGSGPGASPTKFNLWRRQTSVLQNVSAYRFDSMNLTAGDNPEQIAAGRVSVDFFRLFGAPIVDGRTFSSDEDRPGGGNVVVLSHGFWQRRFGGDRELVGRTISLDGNPYVVLGIVGPQFDVESLQPGPSPPDVWVPFQIDPNSTNQGHFFGVAGRLKPGVTLATANAQMKLAADEFRRLYPIGLGPPQNSFGVDVLQNVVVRDVRSSLLVLVGAVTFVLLIACANVANLLLVRATVRKREIAVRVAIGAGRQRIVRQLLTESLLLSLVAGVLGLVLGIVGIRLLLAVNPGNIPRIGPAGAGVTFDWRVVAFTIGLSVMTGVLFGLFPALQTSRSDLNSSLKESASRSGSGFRQNKARSLLVVSEVALALVLLVGAALLIRTFMALRRVDPGFDARQVLTMRMSLSGSRFEKSAPVARLVRDGVERISAVPGVVSAGATCCVPLEGGYGLPFIIVGRPLPPQGPAHGGAGWLNVSPAYFDVFKIPLIRGRTFTDRDDGAAPGVVIINQALARQMWPKQDPLSDRLHIGKGVGPEFDEPPRQIIGIVGDTRDGGLNRDPRPVMYIPLAQVPDGINALNVKITPLAWIMRTRGEPYAVRSVVQESLRVASGGLPVARIRSMEEIVVRSTARSDFNMLLLTVFGGVALLLAAIGIYGLMAYSVEQRTQEIGIRRALGAGSSQVRNMVVFEGMRLSLAGVIIGVASAFGVTRVIASLLFGVTARDPVVFTMVPLALSGVALAAVWLPARHATRIDPIIALRYE